MSTMIRRQRNPRSRKGCITCKERHVHCDERMPFCRNCVRLGRECRYTTSTGVRSYGTPPRQENHGEVEPRPSGTMQACLKNTMLRQWALYYCAPHHRGISSTKISIIQQSQEIAIRRPMPRSLLMAIAQQGAPKYNFLSAQHPCVSNAMIGFAAYIHFRATNSLVSKQVWLEHVCLSLSQLQKEINSFGPMNADAIITASIALTGTTDDWEHWAVFVDGYSKSLARIEEKKMKTVYTDLLSNLFPLRIYSMKADTHSPRLPKDRLAMKALVVDVLVAINNTSVVLGSLKWRAAGFQALQTLTMTILEALSLQSETEEYHRMAILRSWMFWIDLRRHDGEEEQGVLAAFFYALVLAVVPLFPARYSQPMIEVALEKMRLGQEGMDTERSSRYGLVKVNCSGREFLRGLGFYTSRECFGEVELF